MNNTNPNHANTLRVKAPLQNKHELSPLDVTEILHEDHLKVQDLFFQYKSLEDSSEKKSLVRQIVEELYVHAKVEEELVYSQARENSGDEDIDVIMDEADTEHHIAKVLMAELASMNPADDHYDAKVTVLCELIKHHIGEEEKEMFKKIRDLDINLEELGEKVLNRKEELKNTSITEGVQEIWTDLKEFE